MVESIETACTWPTEVTLASSNLRLMRLVFLFIHKNSLICIDDEDRTSAYNRTNLSLVLGNVYGTIIHVFVIHTFENLQNKKKQHVSKF